MADAISLVREAERHLGETVAKGTRPRFDADGFRGPWDAAGFASWLVHRVGGGIYGCLDWDAALDDLMPDAAAWARDAAELGETVFPHEAGPGMFLVRRPTAREPGLVALVDDRGTLIAAERGRVSRRPRTGVFDLAVRVPATPFKPQAARATTPPS
ncbi:hypothetical protein [Zavarzinia sp. CC-PAN008]|uniref:hypothetical protein n=1 Tax=Zavarzinia sp. CC-PAN008 TaxID=3243332 RepID=UPI003F742EB9